MKGLNCVGQLYSHNDSSSRKGQIKVNFDLNLDKAFDVEPELVDDSYSVGDSVVLDDSYFGERVLSLSDMNYRKRFVIGCNLGRVANHIAVHWEHVPSVDCTYFGLLPFRFAVNMPPAYISMHPDQHSMQYITHSYTKIQN